MEKTGSEPSKKNINGREKPLLPFWQFPSHRNSGDASEDLRRQFEELFSDIFEDGKIMIFDPLHSHVNDLGGNTTTLQQIGQCEKSHGQEVDPGKMMNGPIVIDQFGDVQEEAAQSFHRGLL